MKKMRKPEEALKIALRSVQTTAKKGHYYGAGLLATDFIKLSSQLDYKEGVFIGEVLEGTYLQLYGELDSYEIPKDTKKALQDKLASHMDDLVTAYESRGNLINILEDIRYEATIFQFTMRTQYKPVPPHRSMPRR